MKRTNVFLGILILSHVCYHCYISGKIQHPLCFNSYKNCYFNKSLLQSLLQVFDSESAKVIQILNLSILTLEKWPPFWILVARKNAFLLMGPIRPNSTSNIIFITNFKHFTRYIFQRWKINKVTLQIVLDTDSHEFHFKGYK